MITSKTNLNVKYLTKLKQKKYRQLENKYIISKPNIIAEAKKLGISFETISCISSDADYYVSKEIMQKITDDDFNEAIVCNITNSKIIDNENTIVLDNINDPGNMGTILRTALAFNIKNVVISKNSVDLYNPKVISAMQGCHFYQNIVYMDLEEFFNDTSNKNIMTYLDEANTSNNITNEKFNLVVGNEGVGINKEYKKYMDYNYLIDIDFESLNVSIATGIIIHNLTRGIHE